MECWNDVLKNACDYTKIRNDWEHIKVAMLTFSQCDF